MAVSVIARKIAAGKARSGGDFLNPGKGEIEIVALKDGDKPEFRDGATFVAEAVMIECEGFKGMLNAQGKEKPAGNPVGGPITFLQQFDEYPDTAYDNVKSFILTLLDETDESLEAAAAEKRKSNPALQGSNGAWSGQDEFATAYDSLVNRQTNPARGMRIRYSTYEYKAKESGNILTLPRWESVKQTEAEIQARRAARDRAAPAAPKP